MNNPDPSVIDSAVTLVRGALVARLPAHLEPTAMVVLREAILSALSGHHCRRAILDCAQIDVIDEVDADGLRRMLAVISLMGTQPALSGLRPGAAASLVEWDADGLDGVRIFRDLDEAIGVP